MQIYSVQVRPGGDPAEPDVALVKEGFCWPALFLTLPWLLWRRVWFGLAVYLAGAVLLALTGMLGALSEAAEIVIALGFAFLVAAHANDWRRGALARRGYRFAGVVSGENLRAAERRLFDRWPPSRLLLEAP